MLSFDYDSARGEETATYGALTIRAVRDESPANPFTDWDCEPPLLVWFDGNLTEYGDGICEPLAAISDWHMARRWRDIAAALDIKPETVEAEARDRAKGERLADFRRDYFESALDDMRPSRWGGGGSDYLAALAKLWEIAGVVALDSCSQGYSQGDYADVLAVALPAWAEKVGAPRDTHKRQLESAVKLYGAWAWGDVYGYVIESPDGETLDSCWGYYGTDHDESGLAEAAESAAAAIYADARKRKGERLKELIRNRVPVAMRPALLAEAATLKGVY